MTYAAKNQPAVTPVAAVPDRLHRLNTIRDAVAALLVVLAVLLPWNIYVGMTIAETPGWLYGLLISATLMSLAAVVLSQLGPFGIGLPGVDVKALDRLRLLLNIPYFAVAVGFASFAVVQSIRTGGTAAVPPGIGPGAWFGVTGALLAAAPVIIGTDDSDRKGAKACRVIGIVSLVLAVVAVLFNLYWRTRFVVPNIGNSDTGVQNFVVAVAAVLYGIVALLPIIIVGRWIMSVNRAGRLATVLMAAAVLVAGAFVWWLPVGRDLDAFHGIAQSTSTAGVGFEGYLAWVVAAALVGSATVLAALHRNSADLWRRAARKCLVLIAVWCAGSAVLRIVDLMTSAVLDLPSPPYNGTTLMAFDLVVAVLAMWLFINSSGKAAPRILLTLLYGITFVLTVCRVILGVALVPRVQPLDPTDITDVYGNTLAQQITSTFDVALCVLALALLVIAFLAGHEAAKQPVRRRAAATQATPEFDGSSDQWASTAAVRSGQSTPTIAMPSGQSAPTIAMPVGDPARTLATAKIFRPMSAKQPTPATDRIADVLAESTQRFAAGTTYGGGTATGQPQGPRNTDRQ